MITKFEKRIIAFLLAALMCCPVTAFSAVTVNAEETQDTEQQETQSDALADGTAVQDDAAAGGNQRTGGRCPPELPAGSADLFSPGCV